MLRFLGIDSPGPGFTDEKLVEFFSALLTRRDQLDEEIQGL